MGSMAPAPRRLDAFLDHLSRHQARELRLESGKPPLFRFPSGDRASSQALTHTQLAALVTEVAPSGFAAEVERTTQGSFSYVSPTGVRVRVSVAELEGQAWRVSVQPEDPVPELEIDLDLALDVGTPTVDLTSARASKAPPRASKAPGPRASKAPAPRASRAPAARRQSKSPGAHGSGPSATAASAPALGAPAASAPATTARVASPPAGRGTLVSGAEPRVNRYLRRLVGLAGSDLHLCAEEIPRARIHGEIQPLEAGHPPLKNDDLRALLLEVATPRARSQFEASRDADFAYSIEGLARFRANYYEDRKGVCGVFRQIPYSVTTPEQLGLSRQVIDLCWLTKGLVLVTGPTGSGKSTTLASLVDYINRNRSDHIITIEDPIEFVHENKKCLVNQREVGTHTEGFKTALRAALREDPDIVLVGELRDLETIAIALETAETGHLVFGTLHTTTAASTVDRIIDQFPADRQAQIRTMLSESLRGVIAQVLCKRSAGGRVAAFEVLLTNPAVSNLIREAKTYQLASVMQTGKAAGMQTLNDHLIELVRTKQVAPREAFLKSTDKSSFRELLKRESIEIELG